MPVSGNAIHVEGLKELRDALHDIDPVLQKTLRVRFKEVGKKVAERARSKMPQKSGRAAKSVKAGATATTAYVSIGKADVPYAAWLDFGGTLKPVGGRRNTISRPRIAQGRYLYPAIDEMAPMAQREAVAVFQETARSLGLQ
jgi:hypothetical protein